MQTRQQIFKDFLKEETKCNETTKKTRSLDIKGKKRNKHSGNGEHVIERSKPAKEYIQPLTPITPF